MSIDTLETDIGVLNFLNSWKSWWFSFCKFFGKWWEESGWWLRWEVDHHWWVQILLKILDNFFGVLEVWLDKINRSDSMKLLSCLFNVEIQCDIVLPEIFQFEKRRNDIVICLIKYNNFPCVVSFWEYLCEQVLLLFD